MRHIWTSVGYMIDSFRNPATYVYQKIVPKVELRQVFVRVSVTWKVDL